MRSIRPDLDIPTTINIYYTFFYPHLIYGVEYFCQAANFHLNQIYLIQKSALHVILAIVHAIMFLRTFQNLRVSHYLRLAFHIIHGDRLVDDSTQ